MNAGSYHSSHLARITDNQDNHSLCIPITISCKNIFCCVFFVETVGQSFQELMSAILILFTSPFMNILVTNRKVHDDRMTRIRIVERGKVMLDFSISEHLLDIPRRSESVVTFVKYLDSIHAEVHLHISCRCDQIREPSVTL